MDTEAPGLAGQWQELLQNEPKLRIRDAASRLGVSEAELLATRCGAGVTRLEGNWQALLAEMPKLGRVMCLTRNEHAVHERYGDFRKVDFFHGMGQVVGPDIDLRLFMHAWELGFAVTDQTPDGERVSLQFFDACGDAVHKIYLQPESHYACYGVVLDRFRSPVQSPGQPVMQRPADRPALPDAEIDVEGFRRAWLDMNDPHAFFNILRSFRTTREQALRLAPEGYARPVDTGSVRTLLESAASSALPIMVFIGNHGCIQIHTGPVHNIRMFGAEWLNVLDDEFNMHLRATAVASAWVVRKPATDGGVTSLEVFDATGENLALFFGKRKPGEPEDKHWRALAATLE